MDTSWKHHGNFWFIAVVSVRKGPFSAPGRWDRQPGSPLPAAVADPRSQRSARRYPCTPPHNPSISLHLSVRRWAIQKWRGAKLYAPPFGAALGNPEVAGHQTVRATFRCGAGQSRSGGAPNCTRHLSVRRRAIRRWRGTKLYAPGRKMPPFRIENCKCLIR